MLAVVKRPHTDTPLFEVKGDIPENVVAYLEKEFGQALEVFAEDDEELVDIFETAWYKEISAAITPGESMKIYRENLGLTQAELAQKLGNLSKQKISEMENGKCRISEDVAKKLSQLFEVPIGRFFKKITQGNR
jgi:DNA-binding XRE family transcriptional regulator